MTQEDKELLLKDLCARLPYGIKVSKVVEDWISDPRPIRSINLNNIIVEDGEFEDGTPDIDVWDYEEFKPYLFPMSSMTEDQKKEENSFDPFKTDEVKTLGDWAVCLVDFYNKYHFDYHGLIEKGLALDATGLNIY